MALLFCLKKDYWTITAHTYSKLCSLLKLIAKYHNAQVYVCKSKWDNHQWTERSQKERTKQSVNRRGKHLVLVFVIVFPSFCFQDKVKSFQDVSLS